MILWLTADVFDGLAELKDDSVDLVVTSPPFLALRSYLPADHPDKDKEIGGEPTPAEFIDVLLRVTAELRRVLVPTGSICVELGDTYSGSGGAGGDWIEGSGQRVYKCGAEIPDFSTMPARKGAGWPQAKSRTLIPESYRWALTYGHNPFNNAPFTPSPAGTWITRNVVTWCRPNPPVGRLGDKWRPATSDIVIACTSPNRYWDDLATRQPHVYDPDGRSDRSGRSQHRQDSIDDSGNWDNKGHPAGAPLLDYWEIVPGGYNGAHYAVYPAELVEPLVKAMAPKQVCRTCGQPQRRILGDAEYESDRPRHTPASTDNGRSDLWDGGQGRFGTLNQETLGWTDCGHSDWRAGVVLDPFAGSGTTLHVADALGYDAIGIDIDERNKTLYESRTNERAFNELRQLSLLD